MPWLKIFDLVPGWIYAATLAGLTLICGWFYVGKAYSELELVKYRAEIAENTRKAEAAARDEERKLQDEADRIAKKAKQREKVLASNAADAKRAASGLRDQINRLNSRPIPQNPQLAACTREASTARELLGTCAERYIGVAEDADGLRDQVTGLQEFVRSIK